MTLRPAAFLDRDGTIIRDTEYLADPADIEMLDGAAPAIARLNAAGWPVVVVTNQSGIARGLLTGADYERVRTRLDEILAESGARVDATYRCPHHPDYSGPCECRKPAVGMYLDAARDLGLDLARSFYVGDRWRDVAAAAHFGGRGFLIQGGACGPDDVAQARRAGNIELVDSLADAVDRMLDAAEVAR